MTRLNGAQRRLKPTRKPILLVVRQLFERGPNRREGIARQQLASCRGGLDQFRASAPGRPAFFSSPFVISVRTVRDTGPKASP